MSRMCILPLWLPKLGAGGLPVRATVIAMNLFPVQLNVRGRVCIIIGAGAVAARKAQSLLECGALVTIIAPDGVDTIRQLADDGHITWRQDAYDAGCLAGAFLMFAATDSRAVNAQAMQDAQAQNILACDVSAPDSSDFVSPSVLRRGGLTLTVSTNGGSPTLAAAVREDLAAQYGPEWEGLTETIGSLRADIQGAGDERARRQAVRRVLADTQVRTLLAQGRDLEATERARACLLLHSE